MAGKRMTVQRRKILEYLRSSKSHPNADEVYSHVRKEIPGITLATVYRNLNDLADSGEILRFKAGRECRYDADTRTHCHCVCRSCGEIRDVFDCGMKKAVHMFVPKNFSADYVNVVFYGLCGKCRK